MSSPASPAQTRAYIVERLVGEIGEPDAILDTARSLAGRALPAIRQALDELLAAPLELSVGEVALTRFAELAPARPDSTALTVASSPSSPDALVLVADPMAVTLLVCALFGGDLEADIVAIDRPLSPTELEVATIAFGSIAEAINGSGARAFAFKLPLPTAVPGAELAKLAVRDGPAVKVTFQLAAGTAHGAVDLMMPQRVLLKHRGDGAPIVGEAAAADGQWRNRFNEEVMRSGVMLEATMPVRKMTLAELSGLHVGQVIEFKEGAQAEAKLSARHKTLFVCEFGKLGQNYTVRIRHPFDAGKDLMDELMPG